MTDNSIAIIDMPKNILNNATIRPMLLTGTISPYPTVVTVATHHHNASRSVFIFELGTCDSTVHDKGS